MMVTVRARQFGLYENTRVRAGTVFDVPVEKVPWWCDRVAAPAAPVAVAEAVKAGRKRRGAFDDAEQ